MGKCKCCKEEKPLKEYTEYCDECYQKIERSQKLLTGHIDEETAKEIQNYPYGRYRTKIRYWVETTKNGDRFVSQTLNPKTDQWNKPKKSTYSDVVVMTEDFRGYISYCCYSVAYTDEKDLIKFMEKIKGIELNRRQVEKLRIARAILKTREHVNVSIVNTTDETEQDRQKREQKEKETQEQLRNTFAHYYIKEGK